MCAQPAERGDLPPDLVRARAARIDALIESVAGATIGDTFNQFRDGDGDDCGPEAPAIRRENLRAYLGARLRAPVLFVAEAGGWRGARYSGLSLYSERQFGPDEPGLRCSSRHPGGWSEPSGTVVQAAIAPWKFDVVLWNLVPTHPRRDGEPHTNRTPTRAETRLGEPFARELIDIVQPSHLGAIGLVASRGLGPDVPMIRHPSHGGAVIAREQLRALLSSWLDPRDSA
ncbi:MAG: uracil-DNA glycosylase [Candidatus Dormibacteraeota bacterium]|nr:uracil-DNA glycosylase [Candidatus Dormibacteraeota bacterium]